MGMGNPFTQNIRSKSSLAGIWAVNTLELTKSFHMFYLKVKQNRKKAFPEKLSPFGFGVEDDSEEV